MLVKNFAQIAARGLMASLALVLLASCGSHSVGPPPVDDPSRITILPDGVPGAPVVMYSGLPTTFSITGGTGSYIVSSSNQAIVPVSGNLTGRSLTVIPNPVVTETTLTLTARDTGTTTPATVTLLVRPGTVNNAITITPGSSACAPAICSGGDAVVSAVLSQGDIPLPARGVRFEVISGDFRFITSPAGAPETTALSVTTITDETGTARARLRALNTAPNQTGILQVTDLGSGAFQRTTIFIAQTSAAESGYFAIPDSVTFTGPRVDQCASGGLSADVFVFGGTPPYTVSNPAPAAFVISPTVLTRSGASFRVTPTGVCVDPGLPIAVTDAVGRTISVTVANRPGTAPVPPPDFNVAPTSVTLNSCTSQASVVAAGGQGTYSAGANSSVLLVTTSGNLVTIARGPGDAGGGGGPASSVPLTVTITDGATIRTVAVTLTGVATGFCP